ncbi:hypothetical protein LMB49_10865 [Limosilactobacillus reuteri]|uniref:hypothetical protein n=1 Tax=Limosilactobacillus reuteri TaxID=1598 RepID=UPI001E55A2C7|nr:hypothetical protein [Limosilactobacillus reuteri]MCC4371891.1 hypothetical protein [Limosilactobacillus reuteri]MCC4509626.1 hypothetical protein [Limosilactobacillus reuteri]
MSSLNNLGIGSNEAKEQRIIKLRNMFRKQEIITVGSAVKKTGFTRQTVINWCKQGDIPLWDENTNKSVVPTTLENTPAWLQN